ncbi:beta strand repeat-containing protein, partial [Nitratireductor sp. ZSWI3]|uniref:beta strand repeat-containing protein n=1 Tax=Nitratireductor sp. ZSWI3 TaxID=2966359 RepID=UPI0035B455A1|nr:hypothetical protein [Nitratireductor sp. ZSWI3]
MEFKMGVTGNRVVRVSTSPAGAGGVTSCFEEGSVADNTCTSSQSGTWRDYSGSFTWTGATSTQQFGFEAIGGAAAGNFLDEIQLDILPFVELRPATSFGPESEPSSQLPQIAVSGDITSPLMVTVNVVGGTATLGSDFSTPGGGASFTVTIPVGTYAGSLFPLGVSVIKDTDGSEGDETIEFEVQPDSAYILNSTQTCGDAAIARSTYTIQEEKIELTKAATLNDPNSNGVPDAGETITYAFTVTNTGSVDLTNVNLADSTPGVTVSGGPISLAAGASDATTFTASHTLTQADVDAGTFVNQAEVSGTVAATGFNITDLSDDPSDATDTDADGDGEPDDPTVVLLTAAGANTLEKASSLNDTNGNGRPDAGETISYVFTVENTGNVSLTNIVVSDDRATVSGSPIAGPLAPGASDTSVTGSYTVTQADIDAGTVDNHATSTAKDPTGDDVTAQSSPPGGNPGDPTSTTLTQEGDYDFVKEATHNDANGNGRVDVGETIDYAFTVENTGNVSLTDIVVTDTKATISGSPIPGPLAPGAVDTTSVTGTYTVTQADIDNGNVDNVASATAKDPGGDDIDKQSRPPNGDPGDPTNFPITGDPAVSVEKTGSFDLADDANGNGLPDAGEVVRYTFTATNTGNVTLTNLNVTDPDATVSGGPIASLASGFSDAATFTATHVLTQADIDAGEVTNQATVSATGPGGVAVSDLSDDPSDPTNADADGDGEPDDPTVVPLTQAGAHTLVKEGVLNDANGNGRPDAGETIAYTFTVTNTGNVSLTNIVVNDDKATISGSPVSGPLAPGAVDSTSVTGVYTVTQADIDTGSIENSATSTAKDPNGDDVTADSSPPGGNPGDPTSTPLTQEGD